MFEKNVEIKELEDPRVLSFVYRIVYFLKIKGYKGEQLD